MANKTRMISDEEYPQAIEWLEENLAKMKVPKNEIFSAKLLLEETFRRQANAAGGTEDFSAQITIRKRFGDISLMLSSKGEAYDPIVGINDVVDDDEEMYTLALLKARSKDMSYVRKKGTNIVCISVHELSNKSIIFIMLALFMGCAFGFISHEYLDVQTLQLIEKNLLNPIRKIIMSVLMMLVAPLIFFSVIAGFSNMSNAADLVRYGSKLSFVSLTKMALFVLVFMGLGVLCGDLPEDSVASVAIGEITPAGEFSPVNILIGIVPENIISPFASNNLLQVLFMACFFGILLSKAGDRATSIRDSIDFFNRFFLDAIDIVRPIMPLFVFVSMMQMMMHIEPAMLLSYGKLFAVAILIFPISMLLSALVVLITGHLSPITYLKKMLVFSVIPFSLQSGNACMPYSLKFCNEKLGIAKRLSLFSVPAGNQINKNGSVAYIVVMTIIMRSTFDLPIDMSFLAALFISIMLINLSLPSVANAEAIVLTSVFGMVGIPVETVAIFFAINPVASLPLVPINVVGNLTSTLLLAKWESLVDNDVYRAEE